MSLPKIIPPELLASPASARLPEGESPGHGVALLIQGDDDYGVGRVAREIAAVIPGLHCVAFTRGREHDDIAALGVPVHVLPSGAYFRGFAPRRGLAGAALQLLRARPWWRRCARELHTWCGPRRITTLHGNVWAHYLTLGALRARHPHEYRTIWHLHNFLNLERHAGIPGRLNLRRARRGADWLLGVSRSVVAGWGQSGVPARVIHNCPPTRRGRSARSPARRPAGPEEPTRLVVAGRMEWCKGHHVAIAAVARLRARGVPVTLDIFGGPLVGNAYHADLQRQVAASGLAGAVAFRGFAEDFVERLPEYDIALQCRIDPEPCSLYVLECLQAGMPLVASASGGTPELMRDGREGSLYPPGDAGLLATAVECLATSVETRQRFGLAARSRVQSEFSRERFTARLQAFYAHVMASTPVWADQAEPVIGRDEFEAPPDPEWKGT